MRFLRLGANSSPKQITRADLDRIVEESEGSTFAEAEESLGIPSNSCRDTRRTHLRVLSLKEYARRKKRVSRFLGIPDEECVNLLERRQENVLQY